MWKPGARQVSSLAGALLFLLSVLATPALAKTFWELEPVKDPSIAIGTYAAVGGKTAPAGVFFVLKNNKATMPVEMTLISTDPGAKLHLSAFNNGDPFLDKETSAKGTLTIRFRTADDMNFKVAGPAGASYQLSVWRGPEIKLPQPGPIVSMKSVVGTTAREAPAAAPPAPTPSPPAIAPAPATPPEGQSGGGTSVLIYVLLGGILAALGIIAFLIYRGQRMRGQS